MVRASLGQDGGAFPLSRTAKTVESYPMYVLPVKELLEMDGWVPHQDLLSQGKLVKLSDVDASQVIFLSHQWCSFNHPDPKGDQLRPLQSILKRMIKGDCTVRTRPELEIMYKYKKVTGKEEWSKLPESGYVWHDFTCIPQPLAHAQAQAAIVTAAADANANRPHAGMLSADHRQNTADDSVTAQLTEQLKAAVDSIPSYVERSTMLWILVPPTTHREVDGAVCDFNSWRSRGWCRMEFTASSLCTHDLPVLVVKNGIDPPEYFSPCDAMKLPAGGGRFSYAEDKEKVLDVLSTMVHHKAADYEAKGDLTCSRLLRCFAPMMTGATDRAALRADGGRSPAVMTAAEGGGGGAAADEESLSAVERLKRRLKWRDDATEAAWVKQTGWNLLTMAAMLDDADAVDELCQRPDVSALLAMKGKGIKLEAAKFPHRKLPFARMLFLMAKGHVPLYGAMGYGSPKVVTALLQAGHPVPKTPMAQFDALCGTPCMRPTGAMLNGRIDNVEAFLAIHPDSVPIRFPCKLGTFFTNFLHVVAGNDGQFQVPVMRWLMEHGAAPGVGDVDLFLSATPLAQLAFNPDVDLDVLPILWNADPSFHEKEINTTAKMHTTMRRVMWALKVLGFRRAHGMMAEFQCLGTPLHRACFTGNVPVIKALLERGADPTVKVPAKSPACAMMTAYEVVVFKHGSSELPAIVAKEIAAAGYGEVAVQVKKRDHASKGRGDQVLPHA